MCLLYIHAMFIEKEIKILDIEYAVLIHHLEALWAKKTDQSFVRDRYYDDHHNTLRHKKQRLRLRHQAWKTIITQKTKIPDLHTKSMTEQDMIIENTEKGHQILQDLWLHCIKYKEKARVSYHFEDVHFDIDCYDNMPTLLEIEWPTIEKINYRIHRLWLQYHTHVTRWSKKLFKHYKTK